MAVRLVSELQEEQDAQPVVQAIDAYKLRLRAGIDRARRRLAEHERRYGVTSDQFLREMAAEDLEGGDLEYVAWAGEARLPAGPVRELDEIRAVPNRPPQ